MTPRSNLGTLWEKELVQILTQYEAKQLLRCKKVDPPTKTFGGGRIIHLANPFPDFVGTWTEAGGRAVLFEAKTTKENRLPIGDGGLTQNQLSSLRQWRHAGAVVFVLWFNQALGQTYLYTIPRIAEILATGRKSLLPEMGIIVPTGLGFVTFDFLHIMRLVWLKNPELECQRQSPGR